MLYNLATFGDLPHENWLVCFLLLNKILMLVCFLMLNKTNFNAAADWPGKLFLDFWEAVPGFLVSYFRYTCSSLCGGLVLHFGQLVGYSN